MIVDSRSVPQPEALLRLAGAVLVEQHVDGRPSTALLQRLNHRGVD